jgi:hypothetical protein
MYDTDCVYIAISHLDAFGRDHYCGGNEAGSIVALPKRLVRVTR